MATFPKIPEYLITISLIFATFLLLVMVKSIFLTKKAENKFVVHKWSKTNF